ncbi:MAG: hypothetical protein WKF81_09495 [Thermomicrobiales bacterium]
MTKRNAALVRKRHSIFENVEGELRADHRIAAAWLSGSQGRGTEDDWSDIDLHVAVFDECYEGFLLQRQNLYRRIGDPNLIQQEMLLDNGVYQLVMFEGPVMLDFVVHPASVSVFDADERIVFDRLGLPNSATPEMTSKDLKTRLQDRVTFFWLMTPIALKYIARGKTQPAVTQYDLICDAFISVWRLLNNSDRRDSSGSHWLHPVHDTALIRLLPEIGSVIEPASVHKALLQLMNEMQALHTKLGDAGAVVPQTAIEDIGSFSADISRPRGTT